MSKPWNPRVETSPVEDKILKLCKKQKLWIFMRQYRHRILNEEVRQALRRMYAPGGRGEPSNAERMALALVLQVAFHVADHEVPTLTAVDRRWRMLLDCLDEELDEAVFSQGSVFSFRERARQHGLMQMLLAKTVEMARETKGFSHKRLRVMIDSSPLLGAGRVEDTFNLLGRAIGQLVSVAAQQAGRDAAEVAEELELTVVSSSSVKAALDIDWRLPQARNEALNVLLEQFTRLRSWLEEQFADEALSTPPLSDAVDLVERLIEQDTEPDPDGTSGSSRRLRQGGQDRQVSLSDGDMRHGRKSKTRLFVGYKRHITTDADVPGLVLGVKVLAANVREYEAAQPLLEDAEQQGFELAEAHHDRGYLPSEAIHERRAKGMRVVSKPPTPSRNRDRLGKADFDIDMTAGTATCPAGTTVSIKRKKPDAWVYFPRPVCRQCRLRKRCLTKAGFKAIKLHLHEQLFQQMATELASPEGRAERRQRVAVEHGLARLGAVQGTKARYRGREKNQFHTESCALVANLHVLDRLWAEAA